MSDACGLPCESGMVEHTGWPNAHRGLKLETLACCFAKLGGCRRSWVLDPCSQGKRQQPQPVGQLPVREMSKIREDTPTELIDVAAKSPQKARESVQAWVVHLWDPGDGVSLTGQEAEKRAAPPHTPPSDSTCVVLRELKVLTPCRLDSSSLQGGLAK